MLRSVSVRRRISSGSSALAHDPVVLAFVAHAEAKTGRQNEARQILARLTEAAKTRYDL
jgi:hypothetical protein